MPRPAVLLLTERGAFGFAVSNHCLQPYRGRGSAQIPVSQPGICFLDVDDVFFFCPSVSEPACAVLLISRPLGPNQSLGWKGDSALEAVMSSQSKQRGFLCLEGRMKDWVLLYMREEFMAKKKLQPGPPMPHHSPHPDSFSSHCTPSLRVLFHKAMCITRQVGAQSHTIPPEA
ncbi:hypothetical protein FQA47_019221 [Oryzias melastigma]|uniref:Uncharacterized protein n=1 Tax=Oryzias melastigma TaxID=30732 RepID=A0A834F293_ORYME|nr:hypothetical protein FQA47_019221 [Oryzias melastigma]